MADGKKYNRACLTPNCIIDLYQKSLKYWVEYFHINEFVEIVDYESWLSRDKFYLSEREETNKNIYTKISKEYDPHFDPARLDISFGKINNNSIGEQLKYTFWSIITSVNYHSIFQQDQYITYNNEVQNFYISFIFSLNFSIEKIKKSHLFSSHLIGDFSLNHTELIIKMRYEAWEAAKKYVAISLTDRKLNTIFTKIPTAIKLTIHGKRGEFNFISTNCKNYSLTAQHTTGSIHFKRDEVMIDYRYRIERDADSETEIYVYPSETSEEKFDPLYEMYKIKQPFYYTD
ncbi:hypothetical protein EV694_2185 [Volucribacter psittacicida]|uniref:Uncharacterized protein n=1 Tax=Volucribacter psittacicida TaxID=203482 RepID=A0A4R1FRW8_9PAST|nr:hypothetical protein [Volucribacter psittacicida]TCJ93951.1 hypothetical protein EV694_2185 [Volucribacter psittacicida]